LGFIIIDEERPDQDIPDIEEPQTEIISFQVKDKTLDLEKYLVDIKSDDLFVFRYLSQHYLIAQKAISEIEKMSWLYWNGIGNFGKLVPNSEQIIRRLRPQQKLRGFIAPYFNNSIEIYEIPIYFLPLLKQTFQPSKFGDLKGDWRVRVHPNVQLCQNKTNIVMQPTFGVRDYQKNAVESWCENGQFGTISMATGGGKTIVALQIIYQTQLTTLFCVPTIPLIMQTREELISKLKIDPKYVGIFYGNKKQLRPITIGTYNSLANQIEGDTPIAHTLRDYFALIVFDEAHRMPAPKFRAIALNSNALSRLALSATCERYDHNESLLFFASGHKIFELTYIRLCEIGKVAPFVYRYFPVYLSDSEEEDYRLGTDKTDRERMTFFNPQKAILVYRIVKHHVKKNHQVFIFVSFADTAYELYDLLGASFRVGLVLSKVNQKRKCDIKREYFIEQFKQKEISVIITTSVLEEGFNVPDSSVAIIVSGSSRERQMKQRIGRVVRDTVPGKVSYIYEITTEGRNGLFTLDQLYRLSRNGMITDPEEYKQEQILLPPACWNLNYTEIENYAKKIAREHGTEIDPYEE
jgi:superfamily II DNA or RNA helicase